MTWIKTIQRARGRTQAEASQPLPLQRWLWRSYFYAALIPLLVIELSFLGIYVASTWLIHRENAAALRSTSAAYFSDVANKEAAGIAATLAGIERDTALLAQQTGRALDGPPIASPAERARHSSTPDGAFLTRTDNGTTASYYSGLYPIGAEQRRKVWQLAALDPLMMDLKNGNPLISSIYVNTFDSYNRIYPYIDATRQYPVRMDITAYNFYYDADARHNPARKPVWTDAYLDPAGHGWMVSSIAPVWRKGRLEAVVGQDFTLKTIIAQLANLKLPWGGYAVLVDRKGEILAIPPQGEQDFRLRSTAASANASTGETAAQTDRFQPEHYNINHRADTNALGAAMMRQDSGAVNIDLSDPYLAAFAKVAGPDWRLVVIAPEKRIFAPADSLSNRMSLVGMAMTGALIVFYLVFFLVLNRRSHRMSADVAEPVTELTRRLERVGGGDAIGDLPDSGIREINQLGAGLAEADERLRKALTRISEQEHDMARALQRQTEAIEEQRRFVRIMSHEVRTPLAIIDSAAQIIDRKAETLSPVDLQDRSSKVRRAVDRIARLLGKLVDRIANDDTFDSAARPARLSHLVPSLARQVVPAERLTLVLDEGDGWVADGATLAVPLRSILDNAMLYSRRGGPITVTVTLNGDVAEIGVSDTGPGIPEQDRDKVGARFFRGSNATMADGTGIGIHMSRNLLESLGGRLDINARDNGTLILMTVPITPLGHDADLARAANDLR